MVDYIANRWCVSKIKVPMPIETEAVARSFYEIASFAADVVVVVLGVLVAIAAGIAQYYPSRKSNAALVTLGLLAAMAAIFALYFSIKFDAEKDRALEMFKNDSNRSISAANKSAAEADARAGEAIEKAANAELEGTKAKKELLELQERVKARRLTLTQQKRLIDFLSKAEKGEISIDFMAANGETELFATDIASALRSSGWNITRLGPLIPAGRSAPVGLLLLINDSKIARVSPLVSAFSQIGISLAIEHIPRAATPVQLWVGTKP
jgi:hypothetical protein